MSGNSSGWLSCRQVLNIMVIFGFMLNYALRVNLTIAIVEMIDPDALEPTDTATTEANNMAETDIVGNMTKTVMQAVNLTLPNVTATEVTDFDSSILLNETNSSENGVKRYSWTESQKQLILGSFFWGYILTELPGGRLAELIGGHRVFGHSMLWSSVVTLIIPFAANLGVTAMVVTRVALGFLLGASWPSLPPIAAVWIKPMDRSKFISNMMASALGAAITMPICGYLISWFNWPSVFYATGSIGVLWSFCWFLFVFETPAKHPRISDEERREIEDAIGSSTSKKRPSYVPWKSILSAPCVWAIILVHGASVFGYFLVVNQLPGYMKTILQFDIKSNGLLSSLPYFGKYFMSVTASHYADHLRKSGKISTTVARKVFTTFAVAPPGLMFILLVFFGREKIWAVSIFTIALTLNGAVTAGYLGNALDIAPNFSGTIFGMANTLSSAGGFISTWMVGELTENNKTFGQWQIIFAIVAATYLLGSLSFLTMGRGELQSWNNPPERNGFQLQDLRQEEGVPLKRNNAS